MDNAKPVYEKIAGSPERPIIVETTLPRPGEHNFDWVDARKHVGKEYAHFGFKHHPAANPVNIQVYGDRRIVEHLAKTGRPAKCAVELIKKQIGDRHFVLVDLILVEPSRPATHKITVLGASPKPEKCPPHVYTTPNMGGVGVMIAPIGAAA